MRYVLLVALLPLLASGRSLQNVEYSQVSGQSLRMDGYVPDSAGPHAVAVIVHGGAWVTGDKTRSVRPLFQPLTNAGIAWFSIEYRLARGADLNSLISLEGLAALRNASDDVRNAIEYIRKHAAEWSIDTTRIALIGESAGAHLASMAGLRPAPTAPVQAVVAFYSPSDLAALIESSPSIPDRLRNMLKGTALEAILLGGLRQLSPVNLVSADAPPFLLIHGTADSLVPFAQSEAMCAALRTAMDICELFPVPGGEHGFNRWEGQGTMPAYKEKMISWLKTALRLE